MPTELAAALLALLVAAVQLVTAELRVRAARADARQALHVAGDAAAKAGADRRADDQATGEVPRQSA